jgi:hypothetical protein
MNQHRPGDRIAGEYIVRKVFAGGMGVVYLVEHREHADAFVLKTFQDTSSKASRKRFVLEALAWIKAGATLISFKHTGSRNLPGAAEYVKPDVNDRNSLEDFLGPKPLRLIGRRPRLRSPLNSISLWLLDRHSSCSMSLEKGGQGRWKHSS